MERGSSSMLLYTAYRRQSNMEPKRYIDIMHIHFFALKFEIQVIWSPQSTQHAFDFTYTCLMRGQQCTVL